MFRYERFFYIACVLLLVFSFSRQGTSNANILKDFQNGFVSVVQQVTPSVVNISAEGTVKQSPFEQQFQGTPFEPFFRQFFSPQYNQHFTSLGSGMIIRKDGYILTNDHVIKNASNISVLLSSGRTLRHAKVVGVDPTSDLAVIKVSSSSPLPAGTLGDSNDIQVGSWAIAIGNPYGFNSTVTVGVVSAKGRSLSVRGNSEAVYHNLIQTDASINPGNSGGPLVDIDGRIIGMNTSIATPSGGSVGIGFAIPINTAKAELNQLITKGKVEHGWLGITLQPLTASLSKAFGVHSGVLVSDVQAGSPADKAGLKQGDVILKFNGEKVGTPDELLDMAEGTPAGNRVTLEILRGKERLAVPVVLGVKPTPAEIAKNLPAYWGLHLEAITPELSQSYNLAASSGLLVASVDPNSLGAEAGITEGDIILQVDHQKATSMEGFKKILHAERPGQQTLLLLLHDGMYRYVAFSSSTGE